jgi:hypothetical protein
MGQRQTDSTIPYHWAWWEEGVVSASRWCALGKLLNPFAQARDLDRDRDGRVIYV